MPTPDPRLDSVLEGKNAFIKDIFGPTDKTGIRVADLIKVLNQYQFTKVDNCAMVIK